MSLLPVDEPLWLQESEACDYQLACGCFRLTKESPLFPGTYFIDEAGCHEHTALMIKRWEWNNLCGDEQVRSFPTIKQSSNVGQEEGSSL